MNSTQLETLERDAYHARVDHGFFDLLLAAAAAAFALTIAVSSWFAMALFPLVIFKQPLLRLFNREIVEPRVGHVRLSPKRLEQISTARKAAALGFLVLAFVVAHLGDLVSPISTSAPMVWLAGTPQFQLAIIFGVGTGIAGWLFALPRFMAYGALIVLTPLLATAAGQPAGTGWAIATLLILAAGWRVLYRFLRGNPEAGE